MQQRPERSIRPGADAATRERIDEPDSPAEERADLVGASGAPRTLVRGAGDTSVEPRAGITARALFGLPFLQRTRSVFIVYGLVLAFYIFGRFIKASYGSDSFYTAAITLGVFVVVAGFGQTAVMLSRGFDLSIPGVMTLAGILLMGFTGNTATGSHVIGSIVAVLAIGILIGVFNGLGVVLLQLSPIVMTLAMNTILAGVVLVYTHGTPTGTTPHVIDRLVQGSTGAVPTMLIVFFGVTIAGVLVLNFTTYGRRIYAAGSSPRAAQFAGVSVSGIVVSAYALSGLAAAFGGILLSGYANRAFLGMGDPYLMLSLAAAVVGGISVRGGRGYFAGTAGAALILMIVTGVLASTTLPEAVRDIVLGVIIIGVVVISRQETVA